MIRTQAVNLPPWKIIKWYSRVKECLVRCEAELKKVDAGSKPSKVFLPKLSEHWEEITDTAASDDDETEEPQPGTFQVRIPCKTVLTNQRSEITISLLYTVTASQERFTTVSPHFCLQYIQLHLTWKSFLLFKCSTYVFHIQ